MAQTQFTANELLNMDRLLGRLSDIKGTEALAVALLLQKIKTVFDETVLEEEEAKKKNKDGQTNEEPAKDGKAPKKK